MPTKYTLTTLVGAGALDATFDGDGSTLFVSRDGMLLA